MTAVYLTFKIENCRFLVNYPGNNALKMWNKSLISL